MLKCPRIVFPPGKFRGPHCLGVLVLALAGLPLPASSSRAGTSAASVTPYLLRNETDRDYVVRSWQTEQGLPHNAVNAIVQSSVGYLWLGTTDGLACFDGVRFTVFGVLHGLKSAHVRALFEDGRGRLWIGTRGGGLSVYCQGKITTYTQQDGLPSDDVEALAEDAEGRIWVGLRGGVATVMALPADATARPSVAQNERRNSREMLIRSLPQFQGKLMTALGRGLDGAMWLGGYEAGLFRVEKGVATRVAGPGDPDPLWACHSLTVDPSGRLWVAAGQDSVFSLQAGGWWEQHQIPGEVNVRFVRSLVGAPDGCILAGSVSAGVFALRAGANGVTDLTAGLSDKAVESLLVDHEGNLWVGTQRGGLNRLSRRQVATFDERSGLGQVAVLSIAEVGGELWATTLGEGVRRLADKTFVPLRQSVLTNFPYANPLLRAHDGTCWIGNGAGVLHLNPDGQLMPGEENAVQGLGSTITAVAEDYTEGLWLGTASGGLWRLRQGTLTCQSNLMSTQEICALAQHPDGTLWVGSAGGGLVRLQDGKVSHFGRAEGLQSSFIRTLYLDKAGTLWIGTAGGGLSRWREGQLVTFTTHDGLLDDTVSQVLEDDAGFLWLGCNRGIVRVSKEELEQRAAGRVTSVYPLFLGRSEGIPGECTGGYHPAGLKTRSGALAFATTKGIVLVNPANPAYSMPPPQVLVEKVLIDGKVATEVTFQNPAEMVGQGGRTQPLDSNRQDPAAFEVAPGKHRYEFQFTAPGLASPEMIRFRYKLEGLEREWMDAGRERVVEYAHLPAGSYRFCVIACGNNGVWNSGGATMAFTVRPYLWQRLWFQVLAILLGLILVWVAAQVIAQRRHRLAMARAEQQHLLQLERARIARDIHDQLGASLTRISLLSDLAQREKGRPEQVGVHWNKVSETALEAVQAMDAIVWAVNPRNDTLHSLVEYLAHLRNELFEETATSCRLELPPDLPSLVLSPHARHNLFLVVREALHNVLKHAQASEVTLRVSFKGGELRVIVQDNGRGFAPQSADNHLTHSGLENMRRRVKDLGGTIQIETASGKGTTVSASVPVR